MEAKFTKGEWKVVGQPHRAHDSDYVSVTIRSEQKMASHFVATVKGYTTEDAEANAKLIAAAPDLLEAVQSLLVMMERGAKPRKIDEALTWIENDELARRKALAAIKKATI